jgi:hypothetical protein
MKWGRLLDQPRPARFVESSWGAALPSAFSRCTIEDTAEDTAPPLARSLEMRRRTAMREKRGEAPRLAA